MNTANRKQNSGMTLIELMIVIVIIAILAALAYPSYVNYVRKANRGDAQQILLNWAVNQEIWRSNHSEYAPVSDDPAVGIPRPNHDKFTFEIANRSATAYELQATAIGDQANDKTKDGSSYCGGNGDLMTLNQSGVKSPASCWD